MSTPNIRLVRVPKPDDFCKVDDASARPCECTEVMKAALVITSEMRDVVPLNGVVITPWHQLMCKPCAARQILNGIATLAETLS